MAIDPDPKHPGALARLEALRAGFATRIGARIEELRVSATQACGGERAVRRAAEGVAHRLSGTAGSYGFPEVGAVAGELELLLGRDPLDTDAVAAALRRLELEAQRISD